MTHATVDSRSIHISVREARMWVDRILLVAGLPSGYVPAVRECVLASQALELGGFESLLRIYDKLDMRALVKMRIDRIQDDTLAIDAGGMHAWLLAPTLIDLAVDLARKYGCANVRIRQVEYVDELPIVAALAKRHGGDVTMLGLDSHTDGECVTLRMTHVTRPRSVEQADPLLYAALRVGFPVDAALWQAIYNLSKRALAPDSVVSRRHAGPVILQDDGTILGRKPADDDFDVNMLRNVSATQSGSP